MSRTVVPLTAETADELTAPCCACLFWERGPVRRHAAADAPAAKHAWLREVLGEWGCCGQLVRVDGVTVGHVLYAPPSYVPGAAAFPTAPASPDAVLLTTIHVDPAHRGGGLGRMLVQAMATDLVERRAGHRPARGTMAAVEAFGDPGGHPDGCRIPVGFLSAVGFGMHRMHPTSPRLRMELRGTVTWKDQVDLALERLLGVVQPSPRPARGQAPGPARTARDAARGWRSAQAR